MFWHFFPCGKHCLKSLPFNIFQLVKPISFHIPEDLKRNSFGFGQGLPIKAVTGSFPGFPWCPMLIEYVVYVQCQTPRFISLDYTNKGNEASLQNQALLYRSSYVNIVLRLQKSTFFYENNSLWAENLLANPMIALQWEHKSMMNNIRPSLVSRHHKLYVFGE